MKPFTPDASQREVITAHGGHHLTLAPPGCGKTQCLTERMRHANQAHGVDFRDMLCLTFTNRAAREMESRIGLSLKGTDGAFVGNVHRYCSKLIFEEGVVPSDSSIIDDEDILSIMAKLAEEDEPSGDGRRRELMQAMQLSHLVEQVENGHPKELRLHPSCFPKTDVDAACKLCASRGEGFTPATLSAIYRNTEAYAENDSLSTLDFGQAQAVAAMLRKMDLAHRYSQYKEYNGLLDFEDLLIKAYDALRADTVGRFRRYPWIQVDEVQDLNPLQLAIIDLLTAHENPTVMYLGDFQQAIFSFMGAKGGIFAPLSARCAGRVHHLSTNHRSPRYLLGMLNEYATAQLGVPGEMLSVPAAGGENVMPGMLQTFTSNTIDEEYRDTAAIVKELSESDESETTAVIVNSNRDADRVSRALETLGVGHFKVSGTDFLSSEPVKTLFSHIAAMAGEHNFMAWVKIVKGLGVVKSAAEARAVVRRLADRAMLPTDFLLYENSTYTHEYLKACRGGEIVVFDTETTGLDTENDDIVQLSAVKMAGGRVVPGSQFDMFISTPKPLPKEIGGKPNPVLEEMARNKLHSPVEAFAAFMDYAGGRPLVGHNSGFDYAILGANLRRYMPQVVLEQSCPVVFDTLKLSRLLLPGMHGYSLGQLISQLGLQGENSHLAMDDVMATTGLAALCMDKAGQVDALQEDYIGRDIVAQRVDKFRREYGEAYELSKGLLANVGAKPSDLIRLAAEHLTEGRADMGKVGILAAYAEAELDPLCSETSLKDILPAVALRLSTLGEADLCGTAAVGQRVYVSTVHKAKGLEFDNVVIFDAVEGRYPNHYSRNDAHAVEEDARKFYVALSRARKRVYVGTSLYKRTYRGDLPQATTRFMASIAHRFGAVHTM